MMKKVGICLAFVSFSLTSVSGVEWIPVYSLHPSRIKVSVVGAARNGTTLKLDLPGFFINGVEIGGRRHITVYHPDAPAFLKRGFPGLPRINASVMVPDERLADMSILHVEYRDFRLGPVAPSKGSYSREQLPGEIPYEFDQFYRKNQWFPSESVRLGKPFILRGIQGVNVQFQPFQYNPATGILRVAISTVVEVGSKKRRTARSRTGKRRPRVSHDFRRIHRKLFVNYPAQEGMIPEDIAEPGELVIIAYDPFVDAVIPFSTWKIEKGIPTAVIPLSQIGTSSDDIKAFLQSRYEQGKLTYVILVGDADQIPVLRGSTEAASDPTYVMLDGDDFYPDAFISRISANSVDEVKAQVAKILAYEKTPSQGDWYHRGTGIASNEGVDVPPDYLRDWERAEILRKMLLDYTYSEVDQIYDPGASRSKLLDALNDGRSIVNYLGHGSGTRWATTGLHVSDVLLLTNEDRLPFVIDVSSLNGQWNGKTCLAEAFLQNPDGGAVGMFSSSVSPSWVPPTVMQRDIVELLVSEERLTLGGLTMDGAIHALEAYNGGREGIAVVEEYNLFGDCTLPIRTSSPFQLSVSYPATIPPGSTSFPLFSTTPHAVAALSMDGQLYGVGVTSEAGDAVIDFTRDLPQAGQMTLTVTARNATPYIVSIPVKQSSKPHLSVGSYSINDESGNNDGTVDFGERVNVKLKFENNGLSDAHHIYCKVSTSDPYVTLIDDSCRMDEIPAGEEVEAIDEIVFEVSPQTPDGHMAQFSVNFVAQSSQGEEFEGEDIFIVPIQAPRLTYQTHSVEGTTSGVLNAGEEVRVAVTIVNEGSETAKNVRTTLSGDSSYIAILDGEAFFLAVEAGSTSSNVSDPFVIHTDRDAPLGKEMSFQIHMRGDNGYMASDDFTLVVGNNVFSSQDVPKEFGARSIESLVEIEDNFTLADVDVVVDITHPWVEDVVLKLESPSGTMVQLLSEVGGSGNDFQGTILDDDATPSIRDGSSPFAGSYRPEEPLSILNGENAHGVWKLHVTDKYPYSDDGNLNAWSLVVMGAEPLCKKGDVNGDGVMDMLDVTMVVGIILGTPGNPSERALCAADYDGDGDVLIFDAIKMLNDLLGTQVAKRPAPAGAFLVRLGDALGLQSESPIAGLQFDLKTEGDVVPLEIPGLSISVNRNRKKNQIVVYSPECSALPDTTLLHISGDFILKNMRASDRAGNAVHLEYHALPSSVELGQNYPNPFNEATVITFSLPEEADVELLIFDVLGREVERLARGKMVGGVHRVTWNATNVTSGIYICKLSAGRSSFTRKMVLMK